MKTIKKVLIIDHLPGTIQFGEVLKNSNIQIWIARNEKEALECFKYSEVDAITIEPLLGIDSLINSNVRIKEIQTGGVGLILLNNILKATTGFKKKPKVIIYSVVSKDNLEETGFPKDYPYFRKPTSLQEIVDEINKN